MLPEHKTRKRLVSISKIKTKLHPRRDWPKLLLIAVAGPSALPCLQFFKVNKHLVLEITLNCLYLVFLRKDALWLTRARREEGAGPVKISGLPAAGAGFSLPPYSSCGGYTPQEHLCVLTDPGVGALPGSPPTPATTGNLHGGEEGWQISKQGKKDCYLSLHSPRTEMYHFLPLWMLTANHGICSAHDCHQEKSQIFSCHITITAAILKDCWHSSLLQNYDSN